MLFLAAALALHLQPVVPNSPNLQPQLAAGPNGSVVLAFSNGESIWIARSTDNGRTFAPPSKVADLPKLMVRRHRGPRVAIAANAIVVTAIAGDLFSWRSTDGGRNWSHGTTVNDRRDAAREGLHAMAADAEGHVAVTWLDDGAAPGKKLYSAFSNDSGATWSKNVLVYESPSGTICECCAPSLASVGNGEFAAMWRNVLDGSRDFYTLRLRDGKPLSQAAKMGAGTWKLNACPMDGGGIAVANGTVVTAWRREKDVYLAEAGKPELRLATGQDVAMAANGRGAYVVWSTPHGIQLRRPDIDSPVALSATGGYPSIVALPDGALLAAWEENGSIVTYRVEK